MEKSCIDIDFQYYININLRQITAVPIHYLYSETSGVFISNMDIYYLGKLNQDSFGL